MVICQMLLLSYGAAMTLFSMEVIVDLRIFRFQRIRESTTLAKLAVVPATFSTPLPPLLSCFSLSFSFSFSFSSFSFSSFSFSSFSFYPFIPISFMDRFSSSFKSPLVPSFISCVVNFLFALYWLGVTVTLEVPSASAVLFFTYIRFLGLLGLTAASVFVTAAWYSSPSLRFLFEFY